MCLYVGMWGVIILIYYKYNNVLVLINHYQGDFLRLQ